MTDFAFILENVIPNGVLVAGVIIVNVRSNLLWHHREILCTCWRNFPACSRLGEYQQVTLTNIEETRFTEVLPKNIFPYAVIALVNVGKIQKTYFLVYHLT